MSAYLLSARRTPTGKFLGKLSSLSAPKLAAPAIAAALADSGLEAERIDEVILGNVLTAGVGQAPARQAALGAGIPERVPALTINKVCGSGLKAVMLADQAIRAGDAQVVIAGGMESMSQAPHLLMGSRTGWKYGPQMMVDSLIHDGLFCAMGQTGMGNIADETGRRFHVEREESDTFSLASHHKAAAAQQAGKFAAEIVPLEVTLGRTTEQVTTDEGPRPETTPEALRKLKPAFDPSGTVTAGNASQLSDGAAALVVASEAVARAAKTPFKARIVATASAAMAPADLFVAPVAAMQQALAKAKLRPQDIDLVELNEAFAVQCLACLKQLDFPPEKVNVHGGAIALGHPIGASGARILVTLLHALADRRLTRGLAALCLGGGGAVALVVELT
jgi:acetyl-CoA C-acetyltransferase